MKRSETKFSLLIAVLLLAITAIPWGIETGYAGPGTLAGTDASTTPSGGTFYANSPAGIYQYCPAFGACSATSDSGTALAKFVDKLPGVGSANANLLGQYIPIANPDTTTYAGSDYYEIGLKDYTQKMHTNLPKATKLRGYYQKNTGTLGPTDNSSQYLGPVILAKTYDPTKPAGTGGNGKPVRIKFFNELGIDGAGNLFIPMDPTFMGAGLGPKKANGDVCDPVATPLLCASYTQNRATIHLHGGATPWISDGTPHQWITPSGDATPYKRGMSQKNVPDMPDPDGLVQGASTIYYSNQQSARLMFYHDHAYGLTRLNVYAGGAAGYLLYDQTEEDLIDGTNISGNNPLAAGVKPIPGNSMPAVYKFGIPLIIQDKTFVPADIAVQDAKWTNAKWGTYGDLWFPHVYETNQWPDAPDDSGANNFGRWDYGPWFWPPVIVDVPHRSPPVPEWDLSATPEAFMDTMLVNGTAYPYLPVNPQAYRFRILNACNDRPLNLQLYVVDPNATGSGIDKEVAMVPAAPHPACTAASPAATPSVPSTCTCTATYAPAGCFPDTWPADGRIGGVPDPQFAGPKMIQIGTEGGLLPAPVVLDNQPVGYEYNRRTIVVLDILNQTLLLGPAERADVIIDFSAFPGKKIILYNDAPAPNPAFDPRYDYFTDGPDNTWMGGAPTTAAGFGPNTRTIMQFQVAAGSATTPYYADATKMANLNTAITAAFNATQPKPIVPQTTYPAPNNLITGAQYAHIQDYSLTFTPIGGTSQTVGFQSKAIQELWDPYGRMNATLGVELPFTNNNIQTTIPLGYVDPVTEIMHNGETQLWKITHNGVDTHPVHFHLFNVQLVNRVGWDGAIRPPEPNELGWKETVRMKPLEDVVVAFKAVLPKNLPFVVPNSNRPLDVTQPVGATLSLIDPATGNAKSYTNAMTDFGHEYVWHCHILGHEENDFMRPMVMLVPTTAPTAPSSLTATLVAAVAPATARNKVLLTWPSAGMLPSTDPNYQTGFQIYQTGTLITTVNPTADSVSTNYTYITDTPISSGATYTYSIKAVNAFGTSGAVAASSLTMDTWGPATGVTISPSQPFAVVGSSVTITASGTGSTVAYQYQFLLDGVVVQNYSTTSTWILPASTPLGNHTITVNVRTNTVTATADATSTLNFPVVSSGELLYAAMGNGAWKWDGTAWSQLNPDNPTIMVASGLTLYVAGVTGYPGVWKWDGTAWSRLNTDNPTIMVASGSTLYVAGVAGYPGVWKWDGVWSHLNGDNPTIMVASGSTLYVAGVAGYPGVWKWDGAWSHLNGDNPTIMVASGSTLYVAGVAGYPGVWKWDGAWSHLNGDNPTIMVASGSALYVAGVAGYSGVWKWDGVWSHLNGDNPTIMGASGSALYVAGVAGYPGVWKWNGSAWSNLNADNPTIMGASGSALYVAGVAGYPGVWKWNGSSWSKINPTNPTSMVAGF